MLHAAGNFKRFNAAKWLKDQGAELSRDFVLFYWSDKAIAWATNEGWITVDMAAACSSTTFYLHFLCDT
jgi:hypothetical protein